MLDTEVKVYASDQSLKREDQLAWKIAAMAADPVPADPETIETAVNRVIDNAAVALAAINTDEVTTARGMALSHARAGGATVIGCDAAQRVHAEWGAWANGAAVRQLDWSDAYGGLTYSHPSDNVPAMIAVAQQAGADGKTLLRGIVTAYEVQVALSRGIKLHQYGIDQVAHLGPAVAAGAGAILDLPVETIYWAVQQGAYVSTLTRQDRTGEITSWKGHAPGHVAKLAIEAIDRCLRGNHAPTPVYEGQAGLLAVMLGGKDVRYTVSLPAPGEPKRGILLSFPKQWSAEYEAQPFIDLAFEMRTKIKNFDDIGKIVISGSNHMDTVVGTGSHDPEKYNPDASRETLDHSIMYILAVALQDGTWDYINSYAPERSHRADTIALWKKISTREDPEWTRRYFDPDPKKKAGGGRIEITMKDGSVLADQIDNANASNYGAHPWKRDDFLQKFHTLADSLLDGGEAERFLDLAQRLPALNPAEVLALNPVLPPGKLRTSPPGFC